MNKQLPDGWLDVVIGEIGMMYSGLSGKSANDFGHGEPYLTYKQVFSGTVNRPSTGELVSVGSTEKQNRVTFGDILFTTSSETPHEIGMTSVYLQEEPEPFLNSFCFGLRPNAAAGIYPEFSCHLFRGEVFRTKIRPLAQGSTRYNLSKTNLAKLTLSIPPLPEQKKIAAILTSVDDVIENTQAQIAKLQDLKKATMNELLTKGIGHTEFKDSEFGQIPKSWEVGTLADLVTLISGNAFSSRDYVEGGVPLIRMGNLYANDFNLNRAAIFLPNDFLAKHPKFQIDTGDLLMSMTGTAGKRDYGFVVEVPSLTGRGLLNQRVAKIVPRKLKSQYFIKALMRSELYLKELYAFGSGTKQANLSAKQILGISVPVPPFTEQIAIGALAQNIDKNIVLKNKRLNHSVSLKQALMNDLLAGKVRVNVN